MQKQLIDNNPIIKFSIEFSLSLIDYCSLLEAEKKFIIARQLLRSGTSIGANSLEAQNAESVADFIHKFKIAAKEADETQYWLLLCTYAKAYPACDHLIERLEAFQKMLNKIIHTSKSKKEISI